MSIVFKIDNLLISLLLFILFFGWNTDYLQKMTKDGSMYGFRGGPAGVMKGKYVKLTDELFYCYRNQVMFNCSILFRDLVTNKKTFRYAMPYFKFVI